MSDSKVKAIGPQGISPELVLETIKEEVGNLKELFAVGITKDGEPIAYATGDLSALSFAALVLHDLAIKKLNGMIDHE